MSIIEGVDNSVLVIALSVFTVSATAFLGWFRRREEEPEPMTIERQEAELAELRRRRARPTDDGAAPSASAGGVGGGGGRVPLESADLKCAICLSTLSFAVETVPCCHAFCGSCITEYWHRLGQHSRVLCPIDRREVQMLMPARILRSLVSESSDAAADREEMARIDAEIEAYNRSFAGTGFRSFLTLGWHWFLRSLTDWHSIRTLHQIYIIISLFLIFGYLLLPFDLIPEAAMGIFWFLGLVDDIVVALIVVMVIGNVIRVSMTGPHH